MSYFYLGGVIGLMLFVWVTVIMYYLDKKTKEFTDELDETHQAIVAAVIMNSNKISDQVGVVWDDKMADSVATLTSDDILAATLSQMSPEQLDRLAVKVDELRTMKNE